jgi:hypothetical protein
MVRHSLARSRSRAAVQAEPGLARRAARRVQRPEAMDARVRLSSRGQLSDHPESKRVDDRAVAATRWAAATAGRAIILVSAHTG